MRSWFYRPGAWIAGFLLRTLAHGRIEGVEHVPRSGPFIVVANHTSLLDPPVLGWATGLQVDRVVHFMAKIEMRRWPLIGWLATQSGVFFVRRGEGDRASQRLALELLNDGKPIAIFPEGTRSRNGQLKEGKAGAALLAMRSGAPILPVGIEGMHRIFPGRSRRPHGTRVTIRIGKPFTVGHVPAGRLDREALAVGTERMMAAIADLLPEDQQRKG